MVKGGNCEEWDAGGIVEKAISWRGHGGGGGGGGLWMTTELKRNQISTAAKKTHLLHFGVCLADYCRGWVQHCGMTLHRVQRLQEIR